MQPAQDFKRLGDGDEGPNTGGMGAYTPLPWAPDGLVDEVQATVLQPAIDELARRGTPFVGLLYAGLALTSKGTRVIEFNARFGDPETQPLLELLDQPLGELLYAAATGSLDELGPLRWKPGAAVAVVMAAAGYPEAPAQGRRDRRARRGSRGRRRRRPPCGDGVHAPTTRRGRDQRRPGARRDGRRRLARRGSRPRLRRVSG